MLFFEYNVLQACGSRHEEARLGRLFHYRKSFQPPRPVVDVREFGNGNINRTFLVMLDSNNTRKSALSCSASIHRSFPVQTSLCKICALRQLICMSAWIVPSEFRPPLGGPGCACYPDGSDHWIGTDGSFWRAMSFIDAASFDTIRDMDHAHEVGYALGMFHTLLSDLPAETLSDTLVGFHVTPRYLRHYDEVLAACGTEGSPDVLYCRQFVSERRALAPLLEIARPRAAFSSCDPRRPKVNNIMLDTASGMPSAS